VQTRLSLTLERVRKSLPNVGIGILRYSLVFFLLVFGALKWTKGEADRTRTLMANSPPMSWMYDFLSVQGASIAIGVIELSLGVMIASRRLLPLISAWGSTLSIFMFLTTLSFLFTTPHLTVQRAGFLAKDLALFGAAVLTAAEACDAARSRRATPVTSLPAQAQTALER